MVGIVDGIVDGIVVGIVVGIAEIFFWKLKFTDGYSKCRRHHSGLKKTILQMFVSTYFHKWYDHCSCYVGVMLKSCRQCKLQILSRFLITYD